MDRFIAPNDGATFFACSAGVSLRSKYRIVRADGRVEIHIVDVGAFEEGAYKIAVLNKGDLIEQVFEPFDSAAG